jgi:hypothetical protein
MADEGIDAEQFGRVHAAGSGAAAVGHSSRNTVQIDVELA